MIRGQAVRAGLEITGNRDEQSPSDADVPATENFLTDSVGSDPFCLRILRRILDDAPHDLVVVRRDLIASDFFLRRALSRANVSVLAVEEPASDYSPERLQDRGSRSRAEFEKYMKAAE